MLISYPALFYYDPTETVKYFVHFPDFENSATQGDDISDAMFMASDWLGLTVSSLIEDGVDVPKPSAINTLSLQENNPFKNDPDFESTFDLDNSFISMVAVNISDYLGSQEPVKKTLTIPMWADKAGKKMKINFSQTLTDAIAEKASKRDDKLGV